MARQRATQRRAKAAVRRSSSVCSTSSSSSESEATPAPERSFSFACGGWLKMYEFGVAKALQEHALERNARVIGCSAGALTATALALQCNFDDIRAYVLNHVVPKAHASISGAFQVREYLKQTLNEAGGLHRYKQLNAQPSRLTVVYSSLSNWASRRVTQFESQEHLEQSLLASCCAPPIAGMPFKLKDEWVMDGGVFDFQPVFDCHTVTVSPFYCTDASIKPSRYVPMWWAAFPPSARDVEWLFDLGYEDGLSWIVKSGLNAKPVEIPTKGALYDGDWTTTVGRFMGYRGFESRVLDALFVGLFVCLWKPLVFVLLYLELYLQAILAGGKAAVFGAAAKLMISCLIISVFMAALATISLEGTMTFLLGLTGVAGLLGLLVLASGGLHGAAAVASNDWLKCQTCMRNITSLSLFLRAVPVVGSSIRIKRHEFLLRHSFVYRLTLHFV